ncbi:MAG: glycosyltransferase family 4 protein, partial [Gemmatimonadetes bacterium]|nr:glycosyltransferase family 4 protein [Gemmatimonadota bacterium]
WDLERQAQDLRIAGRVVFAGAVEDVRPWVGAFDLFVLTSRREGLPGALMEAMAMGRPVVATDVGGVSEVVGDAGVLVPQGDVEAIVQGVRRLLSDSAACDRLRLAGHEQVQQFSLTEMARATGDLYEELLANG